MFAMFGGIFLFDQERGRDRNLEAKEPCETRPRGTVMFWESRGMETIPKSATKSLVSTFVFPCFVLWFSMVFPCFFHGFPWFSHVSFYGFPWFSHDNHVFFWKTTD
jgi:hypothetical protein